ncbi:MAG: hypothetical protein WDM78_04575 [Puia sp.]
MNKQVLRNFGFILPGFFLFACSQKTDTSKQKATPPIVVDALIASAKPVSNTLEVNGTRGGK